MRVVAIIPAAGEGRRMGGTVEKQFLHLQGIPVLAHTLEVFNKSPEVDGVVLVVAAQQRQALKEKKGMWSLPVVKPEKFYIGNKRSWIFHRPHCQFGRKTAAGNRLRFRDRYEALYHGFSPGRRCKP